MRPRNIEGGVGLAQNYMAQGEGENELAIREKLN
jgi:hypothetical protein